MRLGALGFAVALAATPAAADVVVFDLSGSGTVLDVPFKPLPGAGEYRFEFESSIPVFLSLWAGYEYHWDIFLAPPPKPHHEYLDGNNYPISDGIDGELTTFAFTFVVPETQYVFYDAGSEYEYRGIAPGTPLYEEVKYEDPYFWLRADELTAGLAFDYAVKVTKLGDGGGAAEIPEPGTWALMLLGFGALGVALRRRRRGARLAV